MGRIVCMVKKSKQEEKLKGSIEPPLIDNISDDPNARGFVRGVIDPEDLD